MIRNFCVFTIAAVIIMSSNVAGTPGELGVFDNHCNVGHGEIAGLASYDAKTQSYTITGSGENMWFGQDAFHYLWTTLQGDFILRAELKFMGKGVHPHRKAGWIIRENLNADSRHVNAALHGDGLTSLQFRREPGADTEEIKSTDSLPDVIQLERRGNTFIMSTARFGKPFTTVELSDLYFANEVLVGLYVCSHDPDVVETVTFRNVRIIKPAKSDFKPYQDYIGSRLEIMDIKTGLRLVIFTSAHSIQAPNWSPDGERLIFNSRGLLYQYELSTGTVRPLNTGFANQNNNDHVLSFDGTLLGISHHNPDDEGRSAIYYLPSSGDSLPVMVTKPGVGASYLHGWSPDGKSMIFTGERNEQYDIYTIDVATGQETRLTNQPKLDDGSEYSPDGRYIFFNSARSGKMKLWRMNPDGAQPTQLTFDKYNDWFPHVSPDRKRIVFISFPGEVDPEDHPFYKHCLLRMIPYGGGAPRILAYIYGGQGSINVPSWSPDSRMIAFVTNSD